MVGWSPIRDLGFGVSLPKVAQRGSGKTAALGHGGGLLLHRPGTDWKQRGSLR